MREIAPQHEAHWFEIYGRIALTGEPVRFENQAAQLHRWYDAYAFRVGEPVDRKVAILFNDITERKQAEERLLRNEAYLSEAQRLSHTGSFGLSPSSGELLLSDETFRIFQYKQTIKPTVELVLKRVHPEDRELVKETIQRASQHGKDFDFEHRLLMPDGSVKHVRVVAHAERDRSGELEFVGAVMDVSLAKEAQKGLRRIEAYLSEGQRLSHTASWAWDVKTQKNLFWSKEHYRIYGFDPETSEGEYAAARGRIHPEDVSTFDETLHRAISDRRDFEMDHRIILPGGEVRHIHVLGHPVFNDLGEVIEYIGTVMDVTEQVQAKKALEDALSKIKQSEARLQAIIDTIPTLAWSTGPDGSAEFLNLRWRNYTGLSTEEAQGWGWQAAIHPEDVCWLTEEWRSIMVSGKPCELEARLRRYDGQYRWFIFRADPLVDEQGKIVKWYGTNTDIDDRKRAEEALRKSQAELAHVSRLTTMGEMTASIAHEVNQPLTAVVNNANACLSLLPEGAADYKEVRDALMEIIDDTDRASAVIARVRQLARKAPSDKSLLNLNDIVVDVLTLARYESVSRRVTIRTDLPKDLPPVLGDRVQLQQVFLNLVVNGMDAMNAVEESKRVLIICARRENRDGAPEALVSVQDAGTGVKPEQVDRLFEAFYSTKPQGMGMGLAISRSIIEAHGGRLWAQPNLGPGATFLFSLPAAPEARR